MMFNRNIYNEFKEKGNAEEQQGFLFKLIDYASEGALHQEKMIECNAIFLCVILMRDKDKMLNREAMTLLSFLASHPCYKLAIKNAGAIPHLIDVLTNNNDSLVKNALGVLGYLMESNSNRREFMSRDGVLPLVVLLDSEDMIVIRRVTKVLSRLSSDNNNRSEIAKHLNSAKKLLPFISKEYGDKISFYALSAILYLVENDEELQRQFFDDHGVFSIAMLFGRYKFCPAPIYLNSILSFLWSLSPVISEIAANILLFSMKNFGIDSYEIFKRQDIEKLINLSLNNSAEMVLSKLLLILMQSKNEHKTFIIASDGLRSLMRLLYCDDVDAKVGLLHVLRNAAADVASAVRIVQAGGLNELLIFLERGENSESEWIAAVAVFANLAAYKEYRHNIIQKNGIHLLMTLIQRHESSTEFLRFTLQALCNFVSDHEDVALFPFAILIDYIVPLLLLDNIFVRIGAVQVLFELKKLDMGSSLIAAKLREYNGVLNVLAHMEYHHDCGSVRSKLEVVIGRNRVEASRGFFADQSTKRSSKTAVDCMKFS